MLLIRHLPRPSGVTAPGRELQLQTERAMEYAAQVEQRERERRLQEQARWGKKPLSGAWADRGVGETNV